jgi:hypothetical protein
MSCAWRSQVLRRRNDASVPRTAGEWERFPEVCFPLQDLVRMLGAFPEEVSGLPCKIFVPCSRPDRPISSIRPPTLVTTPYPCVPRFPPCCRSLDTTLPRIPPQADHNFRPILQDQVSVTSAGSVGAPSDAKLLMFACRPIAPFSLVDYLPYDRSLSVRLRL